MRKLFLTITFLFIAKTFFAQTADTIHFKKNAVSLEIGGNIGGLSLNYERKIYENNLGFFTGRIGFIAGNEGSDRFGILYVGLINYVFSKRKNHFEIGAGMRLVTYKDHHTSFRVDKDESAPTANIMYRYQKPNGRFIFRIGWTPIFPINALKYATFGYWFMVGASAGYSF